MKILVIGDIHGEDIFWQLADLKVLRDYQHLDTEYDYYIFLGDYVDSHTVIAPKIIENLQGVIHLKKNYPEKVILLLGNHDISYMFGHNAFPCSGFNTEYADKISTILRDNQSLFQPLFYIDRLLFSHAGISNKWLAEFNEENGIKDCELHPNAISESYYVATSYKPINRDASVFDVGWSRGGDFQVGGIFWADFTETVLDIVPGWHQVVGHTPVKQIRSVHIDKDDIDKGSITYINTMQKSKLVNEIAYALEV